MNRFSQFSEVNNNYKILNLDKFNGRVKIVHPTDENARFKIQERVVPRNKASNYYDSLIGNIEWNVLAQVFFSAENIQIIQNGLRAGVYKISKNKIIISEQNVDSLKIIMQSVYNQYAEHNMDNVKNQVERLNNIVLDKAIPTVYSETVAYQKYLMDQSTLVVPMEYPKLNDREFKQLEFKDFI
jgi:hypothetical protein